MAKQRFIVEVESPTGKADVSREIMLFAISHLLRLVYIRVQEVEY